MNLKLLGAKIPLKRIPLIMAMLPITIPFALFYEFWEFWHFNISDHILNFNRRMAKRLDTFWERH